MKSMRANGFLELELLQTVSYLDGKYFCKNGSLYVQESQ